jgi:hypothetical protein
MRSVSMVLAIAAVATALNASGCEQKGPAERAGEKVDHAVAAAGSAVKTAGDKMKDAVDK